METRRVPIGSRFFTHIRKSGEWRERNVIKTCTRNLDIERSPLTGDALQSSTCWPDVRTRTSGLITRDTQDGEQTRSTEVRGSG